MRIFSIFVLFFAAALIPIKSDAAKDYYLASPEQIARIIDAGSGQGRRVVFLYASWCGYCRAHLPEIIKIEKEKKGSVIAISLDKDPDTFARYISTRHGDDFPLVPIVWNREGDLHRALKRFGIEPTNAIPFSAWLDEQGYMKQQGVIKPAATKEYILGNKKAPKDIQGL